MAETSDGTKKNDLPVWLGIALILLGLSAGGWFLWTQITGYWSGPSGVFSIEGVAPAVQAYVPPANSSRNPRTRNPGGNASAIRQVGKTTWRVSGGAFKLLVQSTDKLQITLSSYMQEALPADAKWVSVVRVRLTPAAVTQLGLSEKQVQQIRDLPVYAELRFSLTDAQLEPLKQIWQRYLAADAGARSSIETELIYQMNQIGKAQVPGMVQKVQQQYKVAQDSMTPQQWEQLKALAAAPQPEAPKTPSTSAPAK